MGAVEVAGVAVPTGRTGLTAAESSFGSTDSPVYGLCSVFGYGRGIGFCTILSVPVLPCVVVLPVLLPCMRPACMRLLPPELPPAPQLFAR
eukprot:SAG11_NODE_1557_length_4684_cov_3.766194_3_plen_91_part_00